MGFFFEVCIDPTPENGTAMFPLGRIFGEVALISCNAGFVLDGEALISCEEGGVWSYNTTCLRGSMSGKCLSFCEIYGYFAYFK